MSEPISKRPYLKRSLIVLSVLLVLAILILPIIDRSVNSSIRPELKDFAVENPEEVDKIFMAAKSGQTLTLEKNEAGKWIINGKHEAEEAKVNLLLKEYMARIKVKNPVPKEGVDRVVRDMSGTATKVEVYKDKKLTKTYYVGGNTADETGSFMYMEGSSVPFVVHIPGFQGYPSAAYRLDEKAWRSTNIFNTPITELAFIEVKYPADPASYFRIDKLERKLELRGIDSTIKVPGTLKEEFMKQYAATFDNLHYEGFYETGAKELADSVIKASKVPYATIRVANVNGKDNTLAIYYKPVTSETKQQYDSYGNPVEYDQDRFYAVLNGNQDEILSVQSYVFKNVLKKLKDFYQ